MYGTVSKCLRDIADQNYEGKPVMVFFSAEWSLPSRRMKFLIDEVASVYRDRVDVFAVDYDLNLSLAKWFGVTSLPAFGLTKVGRPSVVAFGIMSRRQILDLIESHA